MMTKRSIFAIALCLCILFSFLGTTSIKVSAVSVTYANINSAAKIIADTVESKNALPIKVKCGDVIITPAQFMYLASKTIVAINKGSKSGSISISSISKAPNPQGSIKAYNMYKSEYVVRAQNIVTFINKEKTAPNYVTCKGGKLKYQDAVFVIAKILRYYKANKALPNYCYSATRNWKKDVDLYPDTSKASIVTQPASITVLVGETAKFTVKASNAKSYQWQRSTDSGKTWQNITTSGGTTATLSFKATSSHNGRRYRCNVKGVSNSVSTKAVTLTVNKSWLENTSSYSSYLKATKNCQSGNATLKSVGATGIKYGGAPKTMYEAAKHLEKYLNKNTYYYKPTYSNTHRGALTTWSKRSGNCCDLAHLANACARSQGIPARYVHGYCKFKSGMKCGHVWAEFWCGKAYGWKTVDLVSDYNYLGYKNNTTLTLYARYASLPF